MISQDDVKKRLDLYVSESLQITRSSAQILIESGCVTVNGKVEAKNYRLRQDDEILIDEPEPKELEVEPENIPLNIVYEDDDIIVIYLPKSAIFSDKAGLISPS